MKKSKKIKKLQQCIHETECHVCKEECPIKIIKEDQDANYYRCIECLKTYHKECAKLQINADYNPIGPCCNYHKCQTCKKSTIQQNEVIKCTICFKLVHRACYNKITCGNIALSPKQREGIIFGDDSYVCLSCLSKHGFIQIRKIHQKVFYENFSSSTQVYVLVQIKYQTPIHYGWFHHDQLTKNIKYKHQKEAELAVEPLFKAAEYSYFGRKPIIENILAWKGKLTDDSLQAFKLIRDKERDQKMAYSDQKNFKFLVKWDFTSYKKATWEDQYTVKIISRVKLDQYLHKQESLVEGHLHKYNYLIKSQKDDVITSAFEHEPVIKMNRLRNEYFVEIIKNNDPIKKMPVLCHYLNLTYISLNISGKTIIVTDDTDKWEQCLRQVSSHIAYLIYKGSKKSIELIDQLEFACPTFDVLVVSYKYYSVKKQKIKSAIRQLELVLLDNYSNNSNCQLIPQFEEKTAKFIIVIEGDKTLQKNPDKQDDIIDSILETFQNKRVIVHDLNWQNYDMFVCSESIKTKLVKRPQCSELYRAVFLTHVMKNGLNPSQLQQSYEKLFRSSRMLEHLNGFTFRDFKQYAKRFMSILAHSRDFKLDSQTQQFFLLEAQPEYIIKKLSLLSNRNIIDNHQNCPQAQQMEISVNSMAN